MPYETAQSNASVDRWRKWRKYYRRSFRQKLLLRRLIQYIRQETGNQLRQKGMVQAETQSAASHDFLYECDMSYPGSKKFDAKVDEDIFIGYAENLAGSI